VTFLNNKRTNTDKPRKWNNIITTSAEVTRSRCRGRTFGLRDLQAASRYRCGDIAQRQRRLIFCDVFYLFYFIYLQMTKGD